MSILIEIKRLHLHEIYCWLVQTDFPATFTKTGRVPVDHYGIFSLGKKKPQQCKAACLGSYQQMTAAFELKPLIQTSGLELFLLLSPASCKSRILKEDKAIIKGR